MWFGRVKREGVTEGWKGFEGVGRRDDQGHRERACSPPRLEEIFLFPQARILL